MTTVSPVLLEGVYRLFFGRGVAAEALDEGDPATGVPPQVELRVNLATLGTDLEQALARSVLLSQWAWLPLTSVVAGEPVLVWDADDGLVPTHVPTPPTGVESRSSGFGDDSIVTGGGP